MSHTAHVREEALHLENVRYSISRVYRYLSQASVNSSHSYMLVTIVQPLQKVPGLCVFVSITLINGLFEVNCLEVTKYPLMAAADQEAAARKSSPASQRGFSFGGRLIKGFRWIEQFSHLGFLRGSSADMTTIPCLMPIFYRSREEEGKCIKCLFSLFASGLLLS